jgi:hypothetical protein
VSSIKYELIFKSIVYVNFGLQMVVESVLDKREIIKEGGICTMCKRIDISGYFVRRLRTLYQLQRLSF